MISALQKPLLIFLIAFSLAYMTNFKSDEQQEIVMVVGRKCYHLHHWLIFSSIIIGGYLLSFAPKEILNIIVSAMLGFIAEGLLYKDFLNIDVGCDKAFVINKLARVQYMK